MKNLISIFVVLVTMSVSAQQSNSNSEFDTALVKNDAGVYDQILIPNKNKIFSGKEAILKTDNQFRVIMLKDMTFPDGSMMDCQIPFPEEIKEIADIFIVEWQATRPIATNVFVEIFFVIDNKKYSFGSDKGWEVWE